MALEQEHAGEGLQTATAFARTLSDLKQNGCNLLVVGSDHEPTCSDACRRLLGCGGREPRRRLVVAADTSVDAVRERLLSVSATPNGERDTIIDWETPTRSVAAITGETPSSARTVRVEAADLARLGIEIHETVVGDGFESEPGGLRLCFDSLTPLLARYDHETVFRFLHLVTGTVDCARGMGHFHLPVGRNAEAARVVAPLFDAIVELRTDAGHAEQRWHVPEEVLTTDWLPV